MNNPVETHQMLCNVLNDKYIMYRQINNNKESTYPKWMIDHNIKTAYVCLDIFYAFNCHSCGNKMNFFRNYHGEHCSRGCWPAHDADSDNWCAFGGSEKRCHRCVDYMYKPKIMYRYRK